MSLRRTLAICIPVLALGCPAPQTTDRDPGEAPDSTVAADVDDGTVTVAEVDGWIKEQLFLQASDDRDPTKLYEIRSRALDELINERLLEQIARAFRVARRLARRGGQGVGGVEPGLGDLFGDAVEALGQRVD